MYKSIDFAEVHSDPPTCFPKELPLLAAIAVDLAQGRCTFMKMYFKFAPWIAPPLSPPSCTWSYVTYGINHVSPRVRSFIGRDGEGAHNLWRRRLRSPDEDLFFLALNSPTIPLSSCLMHTQVLLHVFGTEPTLLRPWPVAMPGGLLVVHAPLTPITINTTMTNVIALSDDVMARVNDIAC